MDGDSDAAQKVVQELLRELRVDIGLRQVDLAQTLGLPQSMVSKYESGERRLDVLELRKICQSLNVTLVEFAEKLEQRLRGER